MHKNAIHKFSYMFYKLSYAVKKCSITPAHIIDN